MSVQRVTERVAAPFRGSRVDREAGTIAGVLLCGFESANGRTYTPEAFRASIAAYEGRPVNCDHGREATVDRRLGWVTDAHVGDDGRPRGTLHLLKTHPMFGRVMEAAERNPALYGFSHVADIRTATRAGRQVVEAIPHVESIDLVAVPATTKSIFESTTGGSAVRLSLKQYSERFGARLGPAKWAALARVCEEYGEAADAPVMDDVPADAEPADLKAALIAAVGPMLDEAFETGDATKLIAALKDFIKLHAKHTGKGDAPADEGDDEGEGGEEPAPESRPSLAGLIAEAKAAGLTPTADDLAVLEGIPTAAARKAVCERLAVRVAEGERPKSAGKPPGAGPLAPAKKPAPAATARAAEGVPTDADSYAKLVRG